MGRIRTTEMTAAAPITLVTETVEPKLVTSAKLNALLEEEVQLAAKISQLQERKKQIDAELGTVWHEKYGKRIQTADFLSTEVESHSSVISKTKLLQAGVRVTVIAQCTVQKPYSFVKVSRKKEEVGA